LDEKTTQADYLGIGSNKVLAKMMAKFNREDAMNEEVKFSDMMVPFSCIH